VYGASYQMDYCVGLSRFRAAGANGAGPLRLQRAGRNFSKRQREHSQHSEWPSLGGREMTIHHFSSVLIVDDSGTVRSVVRKLLTQLGFQNIDEASDGNVALAKIAEKHFGLVISDWNMEPMSGQILLENVRANKTYANLPFIMMTADPSIDKIVQAKHAGVTCFINKPFRAEELKAKILQTNTNN
jgi:two-component system chemotaxis response regulator CheY